MIFLNSFVIIFLMNSLRTTFEDNLQRNVNKTSANKFQRYLDKMKVLNIYNSTIYCDNMIHRDYNKYSMEIENAFKNIMVMNGVVYIYKRDFYWRTWRYVNNTNDVIFFRSQSISPINCTKCHTGYWVIEENAPKCQYELITLKTDEDVCVFTQRDKVEDPCPRIISIRDIIQECGNPIKTKIRITYKYNNDFTKQNTIICQGLVNCEITTMYTIYPGLIIFQIFNITNDIFYSRIMDGYRNYAYTNEYIKWNKKMNTVKQKKMNTEYSNINDNTNELIHLNNLHYEVSNTEPDSRITEIVYKTKAKISPCKRLQLLQTNDDEYENEHF